MIDGGMRVTGENCGVGEEGVAVPYKVHMGRHGT